MKLNEEDSARIGPALAAFETIAKDWPPERLANMTDEERAEFEAACAERDRLWDNIPESVIQKLRDELAKPLTV